MKIRTKRVDEHLLSQRIKFLRDRSPQVAERLNRKYYWLKPHYIPWAKETWVTKEDVFLPCDFEEKSKKHQVMDLFRAASYFEEHEKMPSFFLWAISRKIGYIRQGFNLLIRKKWRAFVERFKI